MFNTHLTILLTVYEIRDKCWEMGIAWHCARIVQKCAEFRGITVLALMAHNCKIHALETVAQIKGEG